MLFNQSSTEFCRRLSLQPSVLRTTRGLLLHKLAWQRLVTGVGERQVLLAFPAFWHARLVTTRSETSKSLARGGTMG